MPEDEPPAPDASLPRRRADEVRLAVMLLTRLPAGQVRDPAPTLAQAAWAFPLVGVIVGAVGWGGLTGGLALGLPALAAALVSLAAMALTTGALHHDGLADVADGFGGGRTPERTLDIMRDSRIGSYGTLAMILAVGAQAAALSDLAGAETLPLFLLIGVASRLAMLATLVALPAVRQEGLGHAAAGPPVVSLLPGTLLTGVCAAAAGQHALSVLIAGAGAALLLAGQAHRRIGGQTGDVLGAVQLGAAVAGWLAAAAALP